MGLKFPLLLELDLNPRRLRLNGVDAGSTRSVWALPVLQALLQRPGLTLSRADLAFILRPRGLHGDLSARQMLRVWSALETLFAQAGVSAALNQRLVHGARNRTSGPWAWQPLPGDVLRLQTAPVAEHPAEGWGFSHRADADESLTLFSQLAQVMALLWKGVPEEAWRQLEAVPRWAGASAALQALLAVLRGEVLVKLRQFAAAQVALDLAQAQVLDGPPSLAFLLEHIAVQRTRARYAEQPHLVHAALLPELREQQLRSRGFDPAPLADLLNLELLCLRRKLEAGADLAAPERQALLTTMEGAAWASLYGYMASRQFERLQSTCANLAYAYQRVTLVTTPVNAERAMRAHAVAAQIHQTMDLSWNSAWEYIFIGELWLMSAAAREVAAGLRWQGESPAHLAFYRAGVREAERSADPRQRAHALLNLHDYARFKRKFDPAIEAAQQLNTLLGAHPELKLLLQAEGYALPGPEAGRPSPATVALPA